MSLAEIEQLPYLALRHAVIKVLLGWVHLIYWSAIGCVSNQQKWDTLGAERSGAGWRSGELPEGPVVASSPFGGLSLHLLPAL